MEDCAYVTRYFSISVLQTVMLYLQSISLQNQVLVIFKHSTHAPIGCQKFSSCSNYASLNVIIWITVVWQTYHYSMCELRQHLSQYHNGPQGNSITSPFIILCRMIVMLVSILQPLIVINSLLMNNKFKAQTLTGNPIGNYYCQLLASHALSMSYSFS